MPDDANAAIELSVVIPAYNEEKRLPGYLEMVISHLRRVARAFEVLVVDDGSRDRTADVVRELQCRCPELKLISLPENKGKGYAVRSGMLAAGGRLRLFADADGSTPITELEPLRAAIQRGADVAIGSRALQDEGRQVHYRIHRKVLGSLFNAVVRLLAVKGVKDTQCGFKLFSAEAAEEVFPLQTIDGFGFDVEILYVARRKGFRVAEVPVNWRDVTGSKVALLRDSLSMLRDVMAIRVRGARGRYGAVRHPRSDGKQGSRCSS